MPDINHAVELIVAAGKVIDAEQIAPVLRKSLESRFYAGIGIILADEGEGGSLVDDALRLELLIAGNFNIAELEYIALLLSGSKCELKLMGSDGIPAAGNGIP